MSITEKPSKRVMHVPLTDGEWLALRLKSVETDTTLGDLAAFALRRTYPNLTSQEAPEK